MSIDRGVVSLVLAASFNKSNHWKQSAAKFWQTGGPYWLIDWFIDVKKLGGSWVHLDYNISSGPFLSSLGPLDLGTLGLLKFRTFGPLPSSKTSSYFLSASRVVIFLFFGHNYDFFQKIFIIMVTIYENYILFQIYGVFHAKKVD